MKNGFYVTLILSTLFFTTPLLADQVDYETDFKNLYANFSELYTNSEEIDPIIDAGEELYELAQKQYGKSSKNTAVVTYNLATLYDEKGQTRNNADERKAVILYGEYFEILTQMGTTIDESYLEAYIEYTEAKLNTDKTSSKIYAVEQLEEVVNNAQVEPIMKAESLHILALLYYRAGATEKALEKIDQSVEIFENEKGQNYIEIGEALFWKAKTELFHKDKYSARTNFTRVTEIYENNQLNGHEIKLSSHRYLIQIYQEARQYKKSTEHCVAIAMQRNNSFDIFEEPLYREPVKLPGHRSNAGPLQNNVDKERVLVEFGIDEEGRTKKVKILETTDKRFNKNTIEAIKKFRYAPRVIDGKILETDGVQYEITFNILKQ